MDSAGGNSGDNYAKYREEVAETKVLGALRFGILVVIGLHLPFVVLDYVVFPESFESLAATRVSNGITLTAAYILAPRRPVAAMIAACLMAGIHLVVVIGLAGGVSSLYFPGLMLLFLGMPVLLPLSAPQSAFVVGSLFLSFAALPIFGFGETGNQNYLVNLFFPGAAALESVFSCALLDRLRLQDFLRREEIAAARDQLAMLDDAKSRFSANVHHELRTPLTLMLAPLEGLRAGDYGDMLNSDSKILETMHSNGRRLLKLINNLLDLAKLENRQFSIARQPVDLGDFFDDLVASTEGLAKQKGILVSSSVTNSLPSICVDRDALDKIMINLVGNALKFTEAGGTVEIAGNEVEGGVELRVIDSGIGLAPDQIDRVFDRFAQVDHSATRKYEGTGIGLSLAHEFVELHGGRLWASSEGLGHGATMHVFLPFGESDGLLDVNAEAVVLDNEVPPEGSLPPEENFERLAELDATVQRWADHRESEGSPLLQEAEEGSRPWVLVADDNADMRTLLKFILEKEYHVATARNGKEALSLVRDRPPALVVTDVMMPEMSGIELCDAIKQTEETKDLPVMIVSSKAEGEMKARGLELGADDYVTKPFHPREVLARARSLVSLRTAQVDLAERNERLEKALQELEDAQAQIVRSERLAAIGELAAGVAHEVNNPVNFALNAARALKVNVAEMQEVFDAIAGTANGLATGEKSGNSTFADPGPLGEEVLELSGIITDGLERAQKLVGDLRDFAAPDRGESFTSVNLSQVAESAMGLVAHECSRHGVLLSIDAPREPVFVAGDESALVQVLLNLLKNAIEAHSGDDSQSENLSRHVSIRIENDCATIALVVDDNGPGIPESNLADVFAPFFTTKKAGEGTGLGLPMCRRIAESHGGTLSVSASRERGAEFRLVLPIEK